MTEDLVERLRWEGKFGSRNQLNDEAANEIERLRGVAQSPSVDAIAAAVHEGRFSEGKDQSNYCTFEDECESGKIYCRRIASSVIAALAPGNAGAPWPADTNEGREAVASYIYDAFPFDGPPHKTKPAWIPHGNSDWQDKARETADTIINLLRPGNAGAVEANYIRRVVLENADRADDIVFDTASQEQNGGILGIKAVAEQTAASLRAVADRIAAPLPATQGDWE